MIVFLLRVDYRSFVVFALFFFGVFVIFMFCIDEIVDKEIVEKLRFIIERRR